MGIIFIKYRITIDVYNFMQIMIFRQLQRLSRGIIISKWAVFVPKQASNSTHFPNRGEGGLKYRDFSHITTHNNNFIKKHTQNSTILHHFTHNSTIGGVNGGFQVDFQQHKLQASKTTKISPPDNCRGNMGGFQGAFWVILTIVGDNGGFYGDFYGANFMML